MKILIAVMILLIGQLQYRLWWGDGGIDQIRQYQQQLAALKQAVEEKKQRNQALYAEIKDLKAEGEAVEERAREELGMVKQNETFFQILE